MLGSRVSSYLVTSSPSVGLSSVELSCDGFSIRLFGDDLSDDVVPNFDPSIVELS